MSDIGKNRLYLGLIGILVLVIAAMAYKFIVAGSVQSTEDGRAVIVLAPGERTMILGEMRGFVAGLQQISQALAEEDMNAVAEAARGMGTGKAHDVPLGLMGKLPLEFKKLAFGVHGGFDAIAKDAGSGAAPRQVLARLSGVLQGCVACHASYQFATTPSP